MRFKNTWRSISKCSRCSKLLSGCKCFSNTYLKASSSLFVFVCFWVFSLHLDIINFYTIQRKKNYIDDSKIWTLTWLEPLIFYFLQNYLFLERNNVNDINIFDSYEIMQLKLIANRIKDQVIGIHIGTSLLWKEMLVKSFRGNQ